MGNIFQAIAVALTNPESGSTFHKNPESGVETVSYFLLIFHDGATPTLARRSASARRHEP